MKHLGALKLIFCSALAAVPATPLSAIAADWKPTRPINLIVPWAAGGSTDQVTRLTAAELEPLLGQTIVIINQPGASGAMGTRSALAAPKDGYTWTAGAAQDLGVYETLGLLKARITDWHLFLNVANIQVLGVSANSPYKTAKELLDAMKAKPGQISVATAGVTSTGHNAMEAIAKATGVKYRHVTYDGGTPAVIATVAGETDVTATVAVEQADMIRGKRLRPLAVVGDKPLELEGYGTIPPLSSESPASRAGQLLRHLHSEGRAGRGGADAREDLGREHRQERGAEEVRRHARRAVFAALWRASAESGVAGDPGQRLADVRQQQGQSLAGHGRHPGP